MGKPTGFIEFERSLPKLRAPAERIGDWLEFHENLSEQELRQEGSRCMNCGIPFCHQEQIVKGVTVGCPLHNLIPEWNDLVYRDQWREAYRRLAMTNNFPEFTGRVCPAPCESSCVLGINEDAVAIKEIEAAIIERAFDEGWVIAAQRSRQSGRRVAVVGSGPAGLAAADELNKLGHHVTVYERSDRIGGLLMYGIPNMKLDKSVVQRRIELMKATGIEFVTNAAVGTDIPVSKLNADAVILAVGAGKPRDLSVPGRELNGIHFAMELLSANTKRILDGGPAAYDPFEVRGKKVIVIGGGDTGTDCIATSLRLGCADIVQFEIMPQPPAAKATHGEWLHRVRYFRAEYGHEEAIGLKGTDPREFSLLTKRFIGDGQGHLKSIETIRAEWTTGGAEEIDGMQQIWEADLVFLALGFAGVAKDPLFSELAVDISDRGNIATDDAYQTSAKHVFAAGDCSRGQSLVVWAIADGRRAAASAHRFLTSL